MKDRRRRLDEMQDSWPMTAFQRVTEFVHEAAIIKAMTPEERVAYDEMNAACPTFVNDKYQVQILEETPPGWPTLLHLNIKRRDHGIIHDWRDLQAIKNMLVGPENEAVELYPAESRKVDSCNKYHLYVFKDPTERWLFGWTSRDVTGADKLGQGQRPFGPAGQLR